MQSILMQQAMRHVDHNPIACPRSPPACLRACLQDKLSTRILGQMLYVMQSSQAVGKQRIAVALSQLTT